MTTSNAEIARNTYAPKGFRRRRGHLLRWRSSTISPYRLRRAALHLPLRRSERGLLYFHHGLLVIRRVVYSGAAQALVAHLSRHVVSLHSAVDDKFLVAYDLVTERTGIPGLKKQTPNCAKRLTLTRRSNFFSKTYNTESLSWKIADQTRTVDKSLLIRRRGECVEADPILKKGPSSHLSAARRRADSSPAWRWWARFSPPADCSSSW